MRLLGDCVTSRFPVFSVYDFHYCIFTAELIEGLLLNPVLRDDEYLNTALLKLLWCWCMHVVAELVTRTLEGKEKQ